MGAENGEDGRAENEVDVFLVLEAELVVDWGQVPKEVGLKCLDNHIQKYLQILQLL